MRGGRASREFAPALTLENAYRTKALEIADQRWLTKWAPRAIDAERGQQLVYRGSGIGTFPASTFNSSGVTLRSCAIRATSLGSH